jgi:hypothetical protein
METRMKLQMERATRVIAFARAHPSDLPAYDPAVNQLEALLTRAEELAVKQTRGRLEGRAVQTARGTLARAIVEDLLFLAGIARTAGIEEAGTQWRIRYPGPKRNQAQFISGARSALESAKEHEALLARLGVSANLLATIATRLDQYVALIEQRTEWDQARMGARRQFAGVVREMRVLVDQLHVINRHRLGSSSGDFALWRAIRSVRSGSHRSAEPSPAGEGIPLTAPVALPPGPPVA